jgi:two-component system LytT family sensor kinase
MKSGPPLPPKSSLYLICQAGGWSTYFITMLTLVFLSKSPHTLSLYDVAVNAVLSLTGLMLTHLFRLIIKEFNWEELKLNRLILVVIALNLLMALVSTSLVRLFSVLLSSSNFHMLGEIIMLLVHHFLVYLFWSCLYFGVAFFRRYRQDEISRLQWESSLREFELRKLRSQMNPHFVFNALNGIRSLVEENPEKSKKAISNLSNILRHSLLSERARTIPLADEMKTVVDYLELEKIRFEDRLNFHLNISEDSLSVQVPPMMIQTLAENAVKHGISTQIRGGEVLISTRIQDHQLEITLENSGWLNGKTSEGFGLPNTRQRLELLYGANADFRIYQKNENTVCTEISIPIVHI